MTDTTTMTEQLLRVPPGELIIADNIRKTVTLDPGFVSSIKQHGVRVPIEVEPGENGTWHVIDGQLRTLAALDTGRADVPIITTAAREAAARITEQLIINDHRSGVLDADRAAAYQQLFEMGVSADQIARKTNTPKKRVELALAVAGSKYATEVIAAGNVTLDQAASIVEFEDSPDVAEALTQTALEQPAQFDHVLSRARKQRESEQQHAQLVEQLGFEGYVVTDEFEAHVSNTTAMSIQYLYTDEERKTRLANTTTQRLTPFEGLKAVLIESGAWEGDKHVYRWRAHFIVDGWKELGYFADEWRTRDGGTSARPEGGGLTDEEKEARRETRENNKLWVPATEVRRTWIKELLQRKDLPAGWELYVAKFVDRNQAENNYSFTMVLLGSEGERGEKWLVANPTKAAQYLIASAMGSIEGSHEFGKTGWRHHLASDYIAQLSKWGYTLSELEESVAKKASK